MFASACCRCAWWPMAGRRGNPRFPDAHESDDDRNEEEDHLLMENVIESDDEQADPLSPDQIKRYLDESRRQEDHGSAEDDRDEIRERRPGQRDTHMPMSSRNASQGRCQTFDIGSAKEGRSGVVVDEYDDIFTEELDEECDNVVMGAKAWAAKPIINERRESSLSDWIDAADSTQDLLSPAVPVAAAMPVPVVVGACHSPNAKSRPPPTSLAFDDGNMVETDLRSPFVGGSIGGVGSAAQGVNWAEALDPTWRAPAFVSDLDEREDATVLLGGLTNCETSPLHVGNASSIGAGSDIVLGAVHPHAHAASGGAADCGSGAAGGDGNEGNLGTDSMSPSAAPALDLSKSSGAHGASSVGDGANLLDGTTAAVTTTMFLDDVLEEI
eukprot:gnl/TRDRNA2_/TRDRNA2_187883_c0_seq1.p1 gnl/TRDRNA2_/TRDRNA2_187883_c0~~gnl/TRDRNA2_/TRDRNA2_187883_c0_seq1.p1  ORF type:complete len:384 (+),score=71.86 gnl/TRDRNA2_/TRDRNA2_187883_c0_seq1:83-1234(+)